MSPFTLYDASPASCIKHHTLLLELLSARRRRSMHYASSSIVKPRCPSVVAVNSSSFGAALCSVTYRLANLLRHAMQRASCIMHHQISARRWLAARSSTTARIDWQTHTTARSVASVGSGGRARGASRPATPPPAPRRGARHIADRAARRYRAGPGTASGRRRNLRRSSQVWDSL